MNIIEALNTLKLTPKIRIKRTSQSKNYGGNGSDYVFVSYSKDYSATIKEFCIDDILANDWEVVD